MTNETFTFKPKSYGWQELASMYSPEILPKSAAKRLKRWILTNTQLYTDLINLGWREGHRLLTPGQVRVVVRYLGEP
ncbi:MAG: DUF4248 domain-containing protein [Tannerellaceae bacterium]|nr:DUF4248 domain-containing protein [Tannerellaceae bacterium]